MDRTRPGVTARESGPAGLAACRPKASPPILLIAAALLCTGTLARADNIFVTFDSNNDTVEEYASGSITAGTSAYTGATFVNGSGSDLRGADGEAFDTNGNLYVTNADNDTITEYAATSGSLVRVITAPALNQARALAFDASGNLFIANTNGGNILEITAGSLASASPAATTYASGVGHPWGLAFDGSGNLYVSDNNDSIIYQIQPGGSPTTYISTPGQNNTINKPTGIAFDSAGNLFIANAANNQVEEFTGTTADGVAYSADLNNPDGIAFDSSGDLFVVNFDHDSPEGDSYGVSTIQEFAPLPDGGQLLSEFNDDTNDVNDGINLKDGGFIAIETNAGVPLLGAVPEPSNTGLMMLGAGCVAGFTFLRRRRT